MICCACVSDALLESVRFRSVTKTSVHALLFLSLSLSFCVCVRVCLQPCAQLRLISHEGKPFNGAVGGRRIRTFIFIFWQ